MSYYRILGMEREPFSTSPDPEFFYQSSEHKAALYRLRIAIELRRGLSLVLGDVGAGKTTLSRKLSRMLLQEPDVIMVMILNPMYESEKHFLADLSERFHIKMESGDGGAPTSLDYMKVIERFLFEEGVNNGKTIVLLIDESQKLSDECLEVLRSLLNYETNEFKMLQLILMGQMELLPRISKIKNLWDRIAVNYVINPLDEDEVRELVGFRLQTAGYASNCELFSDAAIRAIYNHTQGYPRKVAMICHDALEYIVMHNRETIDRDVINDLIKRDIKAAVALRYMSQRAA